MAAILLIPALINGFPFWFYDTIEYHQLGQSIVGRVAGLIHHETPAVSGDPGAGATNGNESGHGSLTYAGGRSPTYSLFLFGAYWLGSYWFAAVGQALVAGWLISSTLRALGRPSLRNLLVVSVFMAALTALPIFAAEMMPDVFTGFAFVAIVLTFLANESIGRLERWALILLIAAAGSAHQTNLALGFLLVVLGVACGMLMRAPRSLIFKRAGFAAAGLLVAFAVNLSYATATRILLGDSAANPPYLMARILVDGPGRLYLRDVCAPSPRFEICRYAGRTFANENDFLWNPDPSKGVFMTADLASRRRLAAEERAFVVGAVTHYPFEQLSATAHNVAEQLMRGGVRLELELSRASWVRANFAEFASKDDARARASLAFREVFPLRALDRIDGAVILLSIVFLGWRLTRSDVRSAFAAPRSLNLRSTLALTAACLGIWLVANAFLCAAFSGVFDRYQARVIWLVPMLAALTVLAIGASLERKTATTNARL